MPEASFGDVYPLAMRAAQVRAAAAVLSGAVPPADREDLEQEGVMAAWHALAQFDAGRASLRTFLEHVVANRLVSIHRARGCRPRLQAFGDKQYRASHSWAGNIELRADVRRVLSSLQDADRRLAYALMEHSPAEASRLLGIARSTAYAGIRRIRTEFLLAGLAPGRCRDESDRGRTAVREAM